MTTISEIKINRLEQRGYPETTDVMTLIIAHAVRGSLTKDETILFRSMAPSRTRLFLLQGTSVLASGISGRLPLEAIESAHRQNRFGYFMQHLDGADNGAPDQCALHALVNPDSRAPYTLGIVGSRPDVTGINAQREFGALVESLRAELKGLDTGAEVMREHVGETNSPTLVCDQSGRVIFSNETLSATFEQLSGRSFHIEDIRVQDVVEYFSTAKQKMSTFPVGAQWLTVVSFEALQVRDDSSERAASRFLFSRLRDKISTCATAAEFLVATSNADTDKPFRELAIQLTQELRQMSHFLSRTELLTSKDWSIAPGTNVNAFMYTAVERVRQLLGPEHEVQISADENLFGDCSAQGLDTLIETAIWLHVQEQKEPTATVVSIRTPDGGQFPVLQISTATASGSLRNPSSDWKNYLACLASKLQVRITIASLSDPSTITTQIECTKIRNNTNGTERISRTVCDPVS